MRKGFTLVELLVVVLILGILASVAVPGYRKTVETSRATDALGTLNTVAGANRAYFIDNNAYVGQKINNSAHPLIASKYMADSPWGQMGYEFYACNGANGGGCCAAGAVACAQRRSGNSTYSNWLYRIDGSGACTSYPTTGADKAPACPGM